MGIRRKMIIYNLFPLLAGKFSTWETHLKRAAEMGFNWVFVNPLQKTGESGSLYSIADYFSLNLFFVDEENEKNPEDQLKETIKTAESYGLSMMTDLVINHCSVDSELLRTHPGWFEWEGKGRVAHPFADEDGKKVVWRDLAKFNHRNTDDKEGLYQFFLLVVKHLLGLGFRGFRCDAAYQIPKSLWKRLIAETRAIRPDVLFFAETLGCTPDQTRKTAIAGFDYIFNSSKWWDFKSPWLLKQHSLTRDIAPSISFPESHDTVRLCEQLDGNIEGLKQRYLFAAFFSAGVMMPIGYEYGFRKKLHVVKTRPEDWERTGIDLTPFIKTVNGIKSDYGIFQEEASVEAFYSENPDILLMGRESVQTPEESLLILNKDIHNRQNFYTPNLQVFFQSGSPVSDISPEYRLDYVPSPFLYDLRPAQGILLITAREPVSEED
ncbi:MAG: alpha-amylase family glycosyl hydrolase [Nitrospirota bacterium]